MARLKKSKKNNRLQLRLLTKEQQKQAKEKIEHDRSMLAYKVATTPLPPYGFKNPVLVEIQPNVFMWQEKE